MWTLNEIWEWIQGKREARRYQERVTIEAEYQKGHNEKMQKWEDEQWDRDIKYRAEKMLMERNHEIQTRKIKWGNNPITLTTQMWLSSEPFIIADVPRKTGYTLYDKETARYYPSNKIHEKLIETYNKIREEYDRERAQRTTQTN